MQNSICENKCNSIIALEKGSLQHISFKCVAKTEKLTRGRKQSSWERLKFNLEAIISTGFTGGSHRRHCCPCCRLPMPSQALCKGHIGSNLNTCTSNGITINWHNPQLARIFPGWCVRCRLEAKRWRCHRGVTSCNPWWQDCETFRLPCFH